MRLFILRFRLAGLLCLLSVSLLAQSNEKQPVYIYLFSRYSDFVNLGMTKNRVADSVSAIAKYQEKGQKFGLSQTVLLSGALSRTLMLNDPALKQFLSTAARRGLIEFGYDGADEPTYGQRPRPDLIHAKNAEERWLARGEAAEERLTGYIDPASGLRRKEVTGGLKEMQSVFGEAVAVNGIDIEVGDDAETLHHALRLNHHFLMWGLPQASRSLQIEAYRPTVRGFSQTITAGSNTSPELFWMNGALRSSEASDTFQVVSASEGPEGLKKVLEELDRSHPRVIHVELSDPKLYLSASGRGDLLFPPIKIAFEHPDEPTLPVAAMADWRDAAAALDRQEKAIEWLISDYFPANPGSHFVSSSDLLRMSEPVEGLSVRVSDIEKAVPAFLKLWGTGTYLPTYFQVGQAYFSMADTFYLFSNVLAGQHRTGKRPESIKLGTLYGPLETPGGAGPAAGTVTAASVAEVCARFIDQWDNAEWKPLPDNHIPTLLQVGGIQVNAAQFLHLMAQAIVAPTMQAAVHVQMCNMLSSAGESYPKNRSHYEVGGLWTLKPGVISRERLDTERKSLSADVAKHP